MWWMIVLRRSACVCELAFLGVSIRRDWKDRCCFGCERASNGIKQQSWVRNWVFLSYLQCVVWRTVNNNGYRVHVWLVGWLVVCDHEATGGRQCRCVALSVDGGHEARQLRWCQGGSARLMSNVWRMSYIRLECTGAPHQSAFTVRKEGPS